MEAGGKEVESEEPARHRLPVGVAEVDARFPLVLIFFGFLALVLGELFVGVGEGVAGGEHGGQAVGLLLLFSHFTKFAAHLAQGRLDGFYFHKQIADLLEEVMQMERPDDIRQTGLFEGVGVMGPGHFRDEIQNTEAASFVGGHAGELAQRGESRAFKIYQRHVGNDQRPLRALHFGEEVLGVRDDSDSPALGVEDLAKSLVLAFSFQNEDADWLRRSYWRGPHPIIITLSRYAGREEDPGCDVSANAWQFTVNFPAADRRGMRRYWPTTKPVAEA